MTRAYLVLLAIIGTLQVYAQKKDTVKKTMPDYYRKEEIISNGKRYRIHNNYLTLGPAFVGSNLRSQSQRGIGIDFQYHIRRQHFQTGFLMNGANFNSNNEIEGRIGYGYRKESKNSNLAVFVGPNYYTGVLTVTDTSGDIMPEYYSGFGAYVCVQAVKKFAYDFGLGAEFFGEISGRRRLIGFKLIAFFSGAYRGPKGNYNPNVRSER